MVNLVIYLRKFQRTKDYKLFCYRKNTGCDKRNSLTFCLIPFMQNRSKSFEVQYLLNKADVAVESVYFLRLTVLSSDGEVIKKPDTKDCFGMLS